MIRRTSTQRRPALQDALGRLVWPKILPFPRAGESISSADPEPEGPSTGVEAPFAVMALSRRQRPSRYAADVYILSVH